MKRGPLTSVLAEAWLRARPLRAGQVCICAAEIGRNEGAVRRALESIPGVVRVPSYSGGPWFCLDEAAAEERRAHEEQAKDRRDAMIARALGRKTEAA